MHEMCEAAFAGELDRARAINGTLFPLHKKLFIEANPIPVKWVLKEMGRIGGGIRLPLTPLSASYHEALRDAMRTANIL
jgi:4-hydroxy-tetrahydrodipicolinate synthase